ncbi:hypothetical protein IWX78_002849 [Mycetocola sp. CAN_C7]|uniref:hypothetical protein n=1 Tax=Mycetocola sp. CAN_C7 TaxID=2787724 RepID=UPI0018CA6A75
MTTAQPPARRTLLVLLSVLAVLVIIAFVAVFTRGEPALLDESTPEGVVQRYSAAVLDGDEDAAIEYLADDVQDECGTVENFASDDIRMTLVSTSLRDDSADVDVLITTGGGGPFGSEYSYEESFRLVKAGEGWRVETAPWELAVCQMDGVVE